GYLVAVCLGLRVVRLLSGQAGCVLVFAGGALPLVLLTSYAATGALSGSQIDAARLAGGERTVLLHACRHVAVPASLAAALAGVLTLSDPGPGLILGLPTAASEILTNFAARHDYPRAPRQCVELTVLVLLFAAPFAYLAAPMLASEMTTRPPQSGHR